MNKLYEEVLKRSNFACEVCGAVGHLEIHHIIGGNGKRKQHESKESLIVLCWDCHQGTYGVHGREGGKLNLKLKRNLQEVYLKQGYPEDEVRVKMGGKLY